MVQNKISTTVDQGIQKVQDILRNRFIVAIFLLSQGVSFTTNPSRAMEDMAKSVAISLMITAAAILAGNIAAKKRSRLSIPSVAMAVAFLALGIIVQVVPDFFSSVFQYAAGVTVLINGIVTLSDNLHINKLVQNISSFGHSLEENVADETLENLKTVYRSAMAEQSDRLMTSVNLLAEKMKSKKCSPVLVSVMFILLGVAMLIFRSGVDKTLARGSGMIIILSAIYDLCIAFRLLLLHRQLESRKIDTDESETI